MTLRRPARATAAAVLLAALVPALPGCGARPATAPPRARATIASRMIERSCTAPATRQVPLPVTVLLESRSRRFRVDTGAGGRASVRLVPGRYTVAPVGSALRHAVVSLRLDGKPVAASRGQRVVDIPGGRHVLLLLVARRPVECNGLGTAG